MPRSGKKNGRMTKGSNSRARFDTGPENVDLSFEAMQERGGKKDNTIETYKSQIRMYLEWAKRQTPPIDTEALNSDLPQIICQYLHERIIIGQLSNKSLGVIYSAIKEYYSKTLGLGETPWVPAQRDEDTDKVKHNSIGNPYCATKVKEMIRELQFATSGDVSKKSYPTSIHDMAQLYTDLDDQFTAKKLSGVEKAKFKAMFSLAFYCWFRFEEVRGLKVRDIIQENGFIMKSDDTRQNFTYLKLTISDRKTNYNERNEVYQIHNHPDDVGRDTAGTLRPLNPMGYLQEWLKILQQHKNKVDVSDDEFQSWYLFPRTNGDAIHINTEDTFGYTDYLSKLYAKNIFQSRKMMKVSTHTFRRGGAQYRFFYAKKKWNLTTCLAWGGWSKTENFKTLMTYLVNEYDALENDYSDAASPYRKDRNLGLNQSEAEESNSHNFSQINSSFEKLFEKIEKLENLISKKSDGTL